jgi:hypothetical protein
MLDKEFLCSKSSLFKEPIYLSNLNKSIMQTLRDECFSFPTSFSSNQIINDENLFKKNLITYFYPILMIVGLLGNIIALILIFKKIRVDKEKKASFCLATLSLTDIGIILFGVSREYIEIRFDVNIKMYSNITCKLFFYVCYMLNTFSAYMFAFMAYERWKSVRQPFAYKRESSKRTKRHVAAIFGFCCMITLPFLIFSQVLIENETKANNNEIK